MKWFVCVFCVLSVAFEQHGVDSKAFLYNPQQSIAGLVSSASASSSASQQYTNIADLRRDKSDLQEDKSLSDDNFFKSEEETFEHNNNEATPSILQKKVRKILAKLQFLASFSNPGNTASNSDDDFEKEKEDFDKEFEEDSKKVNQTEVTITLRDPITSTKQKIELLPIPKEETTEYIDKAQPKKTIDFETQFREVEPFETTKTKTKVVKKAAFKDSDVIGQGNGNKFSVSPQGLGLYFMELIASAVGLAYGAVAQLQNQMSTGTPQST